MANPRPGSVDFANAVPPNSALPKITSIFDFTAEALEALRFYLEQNPPKNPPLNNSIPTAALRPGPSCRAYASVNQNIPNVTVTPLNFDLERYDTDAMHDNATLNTRITFKTAGKYMVGGNVAFSGGTGNRDTGVRLNGTTTYLVYDTRAGLGVGVGVYVAIATCYDFAANDYVELVAYQNSGGALSAFVVANTTTEFWATRVA